MSQEEKNLVLSLMHDPVEENCKTAFLVSQSWWAKWVNYTQHQGKMPKNMENYQFLSGFEIKPVNFKLISPDAWNVLRNIYDCAPEVEVFIIDKQPDFNPANLYIKSPGNKKYDMNLISLKITVAELRNYILKKYPIKNNAYGDNSDLLSVKFKVKSTESFIGLYDTQVLGKAGVKADCLILIGEEIESVRQNERREVQIEPEYEEEAVMDVDRQDRDEAFLKIVQALSKEKVRVGRRTLEEVDRYIDEVLENIHNYDS
ncbi:hypothetical protein SteCoe_8528 [Stentor coeruleus]|uniref:DUSP domain-containing protein n=1 Tax=Stentor coeruleus TaxID=5963 RepID=A0A1R2CK49_9CILI|nr:hypothetical protein SteCoe_8528 [Stentor coeruleus]